jgi:cytidine deaminase
LPGSDSRDRRKKDRRQQQRRGGDRRSGFDRRAESGWQPVALEAVLATASGFKVGAALETAGREVITGCNVENATYGLTMCAERVALYKALSEGRDVFTRIAIVADTDNPTPPCGSCRQLLWEYCGDIDVILANLAEVKSRLRLADLLPQPFDARLLK